MFFSKKIINVISGFFAVILVAVAFGGAVYFYTDSRLSPTENFSKGLSYYKEGDYKRAKTYLRRSFENNLPEAGLVLGEMALNGKGQAETPDEAARYYEKAAKMGNADAAYNLALMYNDGLGVEQSNQIALSWAMIAADREHTEAAFTAAVWIERGYSNRYGKAEAMALYTQAAEFGHIEAIKSLIAIYSQGIGVDKDIEQAKHWILRLADLTAPKTQEENVDTDEFTASEPIADVETTETVETENVSK